MKILILGATGRTGKLIIEEALKQNHQVAAIARDSEKLAAYEIDIFHGTPYDEETVAKAIKGCEVVINTLNVSRKFDNLWALLRVSKDLISKSAENALKAMSQEGINRFVALSTLGAGRSWKKSPFILKAIVSYSNMKTAFLDHGKQEEILENSNADYTICRAPMLTLKPDENGAVAVPEGEKPKSMTLSRQAAAVFFISIIEEKKHIRQTITVTDKAKK